MVGGIPDYVDSTSGWLFGKGEVARIVNLIVEICNEKEMSLSRRSAARSKALVFSWRRVGEKMHTVYEAVAQHRSVGALRAGWE